MKRQRGIALIVAMLIVVIVASVATYLSMAQNLWLRQSENLLNVSQADAVTAGALNLASLLIANDPATIDHHGEVWAQPLPPFPVGQGTVIAEIGDAQGRFNLNNLATNPVGNDDRKIFMELLGQLGLDRSLNEALIDWIDANSQTAGTSGAEDDYYLALPAPYRAANRPLESVDELRLIRGFNAEIVQALRPFVTVLPAAAGAVPINANTAPAQVLAVLFSPPLALSAAQAMVAVRDGNESTKAQGQEFKDCSDMAGRAPQGSAPVSSRCAVKTGYFELTVAARFGRLTRTTQALVARSAASASAAGGAKILWARNLVVKDIQLEKQN